MRWEYVPEDKMHWGQWKLFVEDKLIGSVIIRLGGREFVTNLYVNRATGDHMQWRFDSLEEAKEQIEIQAVLARLEGRL